MRLICLILCVFLSISAYAHGNLQTATRRASHVPSAYLTDLDTLTDYLVQPFKKDELSAIRAIYVWISLNVYYDKYELDNHYEGSNGSFDSPHDTFKKRSGVCRHFAKLFLYMATRAGIKAKYIRGFAFNGLHAWNAAKINNEWFLFDTTNSNTVFTKVSNQKDYLNAVKHGPPATMRYKKKDVQEDWFKVPPAKMILTHYPEDVKWQLLEKPVKPLEFLRKNPEFKKEKLFMDLIKNYKPVYSQKLPD